MWLVAESGSTKTEWRLFDSNGILEKSTSKGLNPLFFTEETFKAELKAVLPTHWVADVIKLWFYCAGCGTENVRLTTTNWLKGVFSEAEITVESDLLAAARATCGNESGIVAILGTGSNSAFYNGRELVEHIRPLGYILGDEGSGTALGKSLLKKLLRGRFTDELTQSLYSELGLTYEQIIEHVYRSEWPNRFIASCTRLIHAHKDSEEISDLIEKDLDAFVELLSNYTRADQLSLNFVGSIAFYFKEELKRVIENRKLKLGKVVRMPAEELVQYHIKNQ